jgi:undecaprenyl-diphosphatase
MEILHAILLGIIEGLTEFLPISSTGHLIVAEEYIDFADSAKIFTVAIQSGAIAAVIWFYRHDIGQKIGGLFRSDKTAIRFFTNLIIATLPAGLLALALESSFERYAVAKTVAIASIAGAFVLWWADSKFAAHAHGHKAEIDSITPKQALITGLAQCVALIPGTSRSGSAIVGGLLGGMNRVTATAFSFYMAVPILVGAGAYKLITGRHELASVDGGALSIIVGIIVSFTVALIVISWLLKYVATHSFKIFVYYRILLGVLILALL